MAGSGAQGTPHPDVALNPRRRQRIGDGAWDNALPHKAARGAQGGVRFATSLHTQLGWWGLAG